MGSPPLMVDSSLQGTRGLTPVNRMVQASDSPEIAPKISNKYINCSSKINGVVLRSVMG